MQIGFHLGIGFGASSSWRHPTCSTSSRQTYKQPNALISINYERVGGRWGRERDAIVFKSGLIIINHKASDRRLL